MHQADKGYGAWPKPDEVKFKDLDKHQKADTMEEIADMPVLPP